jgi:hypothetical protein
MALNFANNNSLSAITALPASITGGALNLISTQTASSSATLSFTSGIDSTYKEYIFRYYNMHPATNGAKLQFNGSDDSSSHSYDITKTTTFFQAYHDEAGSDTSLGYSAANDLAQGTGFQNLNQIGSDNDQSGCGTLHLYDPSNTTFVKHFTIDAQTADPDDYSVNAFVAGYFNTTAAITAIQFKMDSGNIDSGVIKLYGVS